MQPTRGSIYIRHFKNYLKRRLYLLAFQVFSVKAIKLLFPKKSKNNYQSCNSSRKDMYTIFLCTFEEL